MDAKRRRHKLTDRTAVVVEVKCLYSWVCLVESGDETTLGGQAKLGLAICDLKKSQTFCQIVFFFFFFSFFSFLITWVT